MGMVMGSKFDVDVDNINVDQDVVNVNIFCHDDPVSARRIIKKSYHHGDLRASLLAAATELIAEHGMAGLSLRECARRAGVSHADPYRHFADKQALLLAIARDGFTMLETVGKQAMAGIDDPRARLDAYGVAYVRFAVEHPVVFRLMFTSELEHEGAEPVDGGAFDLLVATAATVVGPDADSRLAAAASWALPHGLAMLILDRRIPGDVVADPDQAAALAATILQLWHGPLR
jgi:AcrR family transcriptional regulator